MRVSIQQRFVILLQSATKRVNKQKIKNRSTRTHIRYQLRQ